MSCATCCQRDPVTATPDETIREAAQRMASEGVGCLVVIDGEKRPVGMITDRDIAMRVLRRRVDPDATRIRTVMADGVSAVRERMPVDIAFRFMRRDGVRRIPIVDDDGCLCGLLTYDDALQVISEQLASAAGAVRAQFPEPASGTTGA